MFSTPAKRTSRRASGSMAIAISDGDNNDVGKLSPSSRDRHTKSSMNADPPLAQSFTKSNDDSRLHAWRQQLRNRNVSQQHGWPSRSAETQSDQSRALPQAVAPNAGHSDIERQSSVGNASDIFLQGRSYRFNPAASEIHHAPLLSPYTATSNTIRDSTALLAGMALRSDDESDSESVPAGHPFAESPAVVDGSHEQLSLGPKSISPHSQPSAGPSNLTRAIEASRSSSPTTTSKEHVIETTDATDQIDQVATRKGAESGTADESTPLLLGDRRGRREGSFNDGSMRTSSKSHSRSKSPRDAGQSGYSIMSGQNESQSIDYQKSNSTAYGYGALAQASQFSRMAAEGPSQNDHHVSFADANLYYDDDREWPNDGLSKAWSFVPPRLRPGRGSIPIREGSLLDSSKVLAAQISKLTFRDVIAASAEPVRLLPAVFLGMLLNALDGVSYGLIIFPTSYPFFSDFGGDGVSMFFVTCVISQLVYTLGGSIFKGGNGSMMIEVVPFYHILVNIIIDNVGDDDVGVVISTTMVAYALSSLFAGLVFLMLGYFRLGVLIGFFPRHILVGCIGGVGVFLIETGMEVAGQLKSEEGFQWNLETFHYFTQSWDMVAHWLPPLALAILLRLITAKFHHPLVFPAYFLIIPGIFYLIAMGFARVPLDSLRSHDWVFDVGSAAQAPFWRFYTYFDFRKTSWQALWATMPTQLALTFFSILHVPLNVPALAVSVNEDNLDTDRELLAHGVSNIAAGLLGSVPNYLCYVNSVLFYRVGGGSRLSGLMLAAGTFIMFLSGPGAIGYLPIMVVGALIFVLGIDLTKEAVWDTIGRVNAWEYFTIWLIIFVMTYYDFVVGILSGIVVACLFFVIQTSRRRTVRAVLDGSIARSTVRRHSTQRQFLDQAGRQTQIVKLQGFLYFANISGVEELIRRAMDIATWQANPIRFLLIDFSLVYGVDFSAAEALTRVQRLLQAKDVVLAFCGLTPESDVGIALRSVGLWTDAGMRLEIFQHLNEALEWTENEYLRSMYMSGITTSSKPMLQHGQRAAMNVPESKRKPAFNLNDTSENSPRRQHLFEAAKEAVRRASKKQILPPATASTTDQQADQTTPTSKGSAPALNNERRRSSQVGKAGAALLGPQPHALLIITFQEWSASQHDDEFFRALAPYFVEHRLLKGEVLWNRGDASDAVYLIESGILKARYDFPQEDYEINEAMLAGTVAGELSFLSRAPRDTTAYAEMDCALWKLDTDHVEKLRKERHQLFDMFLQLLLCACKEEQQGLMSYLVSRLS